MDERESLVAAIAALEAQRALLGNAIVDTALGPMREHLARLATPVPGAPPEQALRQVSVLFMDVVGSTALSGLIDPEEVSAVIDGLLAQCTDCVVSHGGRVLQYAGDNLLAAFGADGAQEDDAERAVQCGLALLVAGRTLRERVLRDHGHDGANVRVGIHTGPVLLGGGVDEEGTIRGLAVNIASRMEQTAPPGALRISHDTWLLVRGSFDASPQAPLRVKGRNEPMLTYLVQQARPAMQREAARGLGGSEPLPLLVGRAAELARMLALLSDATAQRRLQALTLIGEPGVGKSRLLRELAAAAAADGRVVLLGRAHPRSRLQTYGLLRNWLAAWLQIADSDTLDQARHALVEGLLPWLGSPSDHALAKARLIGQLIGLDFTDSLRGIEPSALRQRAFSALHDVLRALGNAGLLPLLMLEDLHWADDGSLDFVHDLLQNADAPPLALLATARPELVERRADWHQATTGHTVMHLAALPAAQADLLANALLRHVDQGDGLRQRLVELADGNPFFMEELVRMCLDQGVIVQEGERWRMLPERLNKAQMPTTLVAVLQARLDALPPAQRKALQQASIVGHVFWDDALAALDTAALASLPALCGRQLVQQREDSAFDDTPEEAFRHHLLQQVTYDTVLKPARQAGHAAAAAWLAERMGDRSSEFLAITGLHYERAGQMALAADYHERAAHEAQARFANAAVLSHAERALACVPAADGARRFRLHGVRLHAADNLGQRSIQEAEVQHRRRVAQALGDVGLLAQATMDDALLASRRGDETRAQALAEEAAELAARSGAVMAGAMAQAQIAWSRYMLGDLEAARRLAARAVADARLTCQQTDTLASRTLLAKTLAVEAIVLQSAGARRQSMLSRAEALRLAKADGLRALQANLMQSLGSMALDLGRFDEACGHFRESTVLANEVGLTSLLACGLLNLGRSERERGNAAAARELAAQGEAVASAGEMRELIGRCALLHAQLHADAAELDAADAGFAAAAATFQASGMPHFVAQADAGRAAVALARGDDDGARHWAERVAEVLESGVSMLVVEDVVWASWTCHRVWAKLGDPRARTALARAHADLQACADCAGDPEFGRQVLENLPLNRQVMEAWAALDEHHKAPDAAPQLRESPGTMPD